MKLRFINLNIIVTGTTKENVAAQNVAAWFLGGMCIWWYFNHLIESNLVDTALKRNYVEMAYVEIIS